MKLLDGKIIAEKILKNVKKDIQENNLKPKAAILSVSQNSATKIYLQKKKEAANYVGIDLQIFNLQDQLENEVISQIQKLNQDSKYCGILVQLPLPKHLNTNKILSLIDSHKDIDGLASAAMRNFADIEFISPTAQSVIEILNYYIQNWQKNTCIIIGKGLLVGLPLEYLMQQAKVTRLITVDEHSENILAKIQKADIIISATGITDLVAVDQIKMGAILIDCGSPKPEIRQDGIEQKAKMITPVPCGIGPVSVAILMRNILKASRLNSKVKMKKSKS
jgi:methylenetetrahydrofolate dehydrogenase (NADP+)/methenyltetrahydrofolate cyclohydrolase